MMPHFCCHQVTLLLELLEDSPEFDAVQPEGLTPAEYRQVRSCLTCQLLLPLCFGTHAALANACRMMLSQVQDSAVQASYQRYKEKKRERKLREQQEV